VNVPTARWLRLSAIRDCAEFFISTHHPGGGIPVPIEHIIDVDLGIDIIPLPGLMDAFHWDGFLSSDLRSIHVDANAYESFPTRYRFTLAHEVGHLVLHGDVYKSCSIHSIDDYKAFDAGIDVKEKGRMDWQASRFAGYVLVPAAQLQGAWAEIGPYLSEMATEARNSGFTPREYRPMLCETAAAELCAQFDISEPAMAIRIETGFEDGSITPL
jgi:Zn-dependent peptidase ImmA (M78 family)